MKTFNIKRTYIVLAACFVFLSLGLVLTSCGGSQKALTNEQCEKILRDNGANYTPSSKYSKTFGGYETTISSYLTFDRTAKNTCYGYFRTFKDPTYNDEKNIEQAKKYCNFSHIDKDWIDKKTYIDEETEHTSTLYVSHILYEDIVEYRYVYRIDNTLYQFEATGQGVEEGIAIAKLIGYYNEELSQFPPKN